MAYSQDDLDRLQANIAKGVRRCRINGEEVEFASLADMMRLEAKIKAALGQGPQRRTAYVRTSHGW